MAATHRKLTVADIVMTALVQAGGKYIEHWQIKNVSINVQEDAVYGTLYDDGDGPSYRFRIDLASINGEVT